jgi:hypothetical protein
MGRATSPTLWRNSVKIDFSNYRKNVNLLKSLLDSKGKVQLSFEDEEGKMVFEDPKAYLSINFSYEKEAGEDDPEVILIDRAQLQHVILSYDKDLTFVQDANKNYLFKSGKDKIKLSVIKNPAVKLGADEDRVAEGEKLLLTDSSLQAVEKTIRFLDPSSDRVIVVAKNKALSYSQRKIFYTPCDMVTEDNVGPYYLTPGLVTLMLHVGNGGEIIFTGDRFVYEKQNEIFVQIAYEDGEIQALEDSVLETLRSRDNSSFSLGKGEFLEILSLVSPFFVASSLKPLWFIFEEDGLNLKFKSETSEFERKIEAEVPEDMVGEEALVPSDPFKVFVEKIVPGEDVLVSMTDLGIIFSLSEEESSDSVDTETVIINAKIKN